MQESLQLFHQYFDRLLKYKAQTSFFIFILIIIRVDAMEIFMLKQIFKNAAFGTKFGRAITKGLLKYHNQIQFIGYEFANAALAARGLLSGEETMSQTYEVLTAGSFATGSFSITRFDFEKRPEMLMWGGLLLALGGGFLSASGYPASGIPVAIASMETARGGFNALEASLHASPSNGREFSKLSYKAMKYPLKPYKFLVEDVISKVGSLGKFLEERPFVSGTFIKSPPRLTYIYQKAIQRDWLGVGVGLSWLILGDGALTLNDEKLKNSIQDNLDAYDDSSKPPEHAPSF